MESAIRTEALVKKFRKVEALRGLDLEVPRGAIYALVGPNGAGKTTAIKILMNIFTATSGSAEVLGSDSRQIRGLAFRTIGYVSENQQMPGWMRVDALMAYLRPFYATWDRELEKALLQRLELPPDRQVGKLSRGMRMKAALVSALAYHPKLVVLDEPFGGLDPLVRDELVEAIVDQAPEATIFVSSHDLAEIEHLASHVGYLHEGRLRFSEEITVLMDRFREVELTLTGATAAKKPYPESWMQLETTGSVVRFVESRFDQERTTNEVRSRVEGVRDITFSPMSLRTIFLAMARSTRGSSTERS